MYKHYYKKFFPRWIPTRVLICLMMFTACWINYMCRLQMPILAIPMVKAGVGNQTGGVCNQDSFRVRRAISWLDPGAYLEDYILKERLEAAEESMMHVRLSRSISEKKARSTSDLTYVLFDDEPFEWSPLVRGQLIAAYSYGNVPGNILGSVLTVRFGPRASIFWTTLLAASVSLMTPILAQVHWGLLVASRVVIGITGGVTFPACHTLVAKWAPPNERARFIWSLLGGTFGTVFTYPMVAGIAESLNWRSGWYIPALLTFVWIIFWFILAYDSPGEHPGITDEERDYILHSQEGTVTAKKPTLAETPLGQIFRSIPFISLVFCHFGNLFLLFFYQNSMMLYLTKALGFQLSKGGMAASMPWAGRMIFGYFFSWIGDTIKRKQICSITVLRKTATVFSHFLPGIFLILVGYVGCNLVLANVFLIMALGFNGAASIANLSNNQDLSPNFAGFLYGIMNTVGSASGMIISPMVEEIAGKHGNAIDRWQTLFWIGAAVCIGCMLIFLFGGSGNIQSWNEISPDRRREDRQ